MKGSYNISTSESIRYRLRYSAGERPVWRLKKRGK